MTSTTEFAVLNIGSRELLTGWVSSREEAERLAAECEQHESQPDCKIVSRSTAAIVCGKTIQIDLSGVGHNWQPLPVDDMSEDLEDLLAAEILDGGEYGRVTIGGVHYRWK